MKSPILLSAATIAALASSQVSAESLGAHVHGQAALNIAFEGDAVLMEFEAPGADIVGFEHQARSAEDRAAVDAAIAVLAEPLALFTPDAAAGCVVTAASVELISDGGGHDHDDHAKADDDHDHDHDDHAKADDDHDHGHDDHAEGESGGHTEFHAEYALTCADPGAIQAIEFVYFERFANSEEVEVQLISEKGSKGFDVTRASPRLDLAGAI